MYTETFLSARIPVTAIETSIIISTQIEALFFKVQGDSFNKYLG
jgi:hypothetical protein